MKVVSDTGPLIGLAKANLLSIFQAMGLEVLVPPMVHRELLSKIGNESQQIEDALNDFIQTVDPKPMDKTLETVLLHLDEGEKQAVSLAYSTKQDILLLIDDRVGRSAAKKLNIPVTGLVGILIMAKEKGLIANIEQVLDKIRNNGYWLSDKIIDFAILLAGEKKSQNSSESQ